MVVDGDKFLGLVKYAGMTQNQKGEEQLELGVQLTKRLLGDTPDGGTEDCPVSTVSVFLHLDEAGSNAEQRRGISRTQIENLVGVRLKDDWSDEGYWRLFEDHPKSLIKAIEGTQVTVVAKELSNKILWNLYFPRSKPAVRSYKDIKSKLPAY